MKHFHIYQRIKNRPTYFRCIHPDCKHYLEKELVIGRRAECPYCHDDYVIQRRDLNNKTPHCSNCIAPGYENNTKTTKMKPKDKLRVTKLQTLFEDKVSKFLEGVER